MKELRKKWYRFFKNEGKVCGALFGIVLLGVLVIEFLSPGRLGTVDTGKYDIIMKEAGLKYTENELQSDRPLTYDHVIEEYDYGHFSYTKLLAPSGIHSVIYPLSLIRAVTKPFGIKFSMKYLYLLYALLAAICVSVITRGITEAWGAPLGVIAGVILIFLLADGNLNAYFGSLYDTGTVVMGLLLVMASLIRSFSYRKGKGFITIFPVIVSFLFLFNASTLSILFFPAAIWSGIILLKKEQKNFYHKKIAVFLITGLLVTGVSSSLRLINENPDMQSDASVYSCAFQGFLEESDKPEKDLEYFGLDEDYVKDIGKSYYMEESEYQHNPRDEKEAENLFSKLNRKTIASWYLKNPWRIIRTVMGQSEKFDSLESQRLLKLGQNTLQSDKVSRIWSTANLILGVIFPSDYSGAWALLGISGILLVIAVFFEIKKKREEILYAVLVFLLELAALGYVPAHLFFMGRDSLELSRIIAVFTIAVIVGGLFIFCVRVCEMVSVWFQKLQVSKLQFQEAREYVEKTSSAISDTGPKQQNELSEMIIQAIRKWLLNITADRRKTVFFLSGVFVIMACIVLFAVPRAGCVNNGDFGRMMEQLGLIWQGDIFYDVDAQLGKRVIEEYAYRAAFQLTDLTFLSPKYSLIFPSTLVRGICAVLNRPFSTHLLSIVMTVVLLICLISIIKDLYSFFGRFTLFVGLGISAVFLCESYLVWFNSLFGESAMFLGLFMVVACGIHLAVVSQGKGCIGVFLLIFACRFLVCAKAQMLVTLPILLFVIIVFALYHRPLRLGRLIPYTLMILLSMAMISYEGIKVYQDNGDISERQTLWQATFYGALMVSDNPEKDMEELGIDSRMAADIGKDAYQADEDYVISPNSAEADEAFYDHVTTGKLVKYYLKRPVQLIRMLNHAAEVSQEMYNGFRAYLGQDYSGDHDTVDRFGLWLYWRPVFTFSSFWGYVLVYGSLLVLCIYLLTQKQLEMKRKLLVVIYIAVMLIGAIQYPLSVVGNGFADNQKQMFGFMMCHDLLTIITLGVCLKVLWEHRKKLNWKKVNGFKKKIIQLRK